jgi:hypothetical protein
MQDQWLIVIGMRADGRGCFLLVGHFHFIKLRRQKVRSYVFVPMIIKFGRGQNSRDAIILSYSIDFVEGSSIYKVSFLTVTYQFVVGMAVL